MVSGAGGGSSEFMVELTGQDPIAGVLRSDRDERRFEGWLELLSALEDVQQRARLSRDSRLGEPTPPAGSEISDEEGRR